MSEEALTTPESEISIQLLAEARHEMMVEADPFQQTFMMIAALDAGDTEVDGHQLLLAYTAIGEFDGDYQHDTPEERQLGAGVAVVKALADGRRFDEAYAVALSLDRVSDLYGLKAKGILLKHGYSGHQGESLHTLDRKYLDNLPGEDGPIGTQERRHKWYMASIFLDSLVAYGIDVTDPNGEHVEAYELYKSLLNSDPLGPERSNAQLARTAANYGNVPLAEKLLDEGTWTPRHKADVLLAIASATQGDDMSALQRLETVQRELVTYRDKHSPKSAEEVALARATLHARIGDLETARNIERRYANTVAAYERQESIPFAKECLKLYVELYKAEGREEDRLIALRLLNERRLYLNEEGPSATTIPKLIGDIIEADIKFGKTMPSLELEEQDGIPLMVYEVESAVFAEPSDGARRFMVNERSKAFIEALLGHEVDLEEMELEERNESKDQARAAVATAVAKYTPRTAESITRLINNPVTRVGAKIAVGLQLSAA